MKDDDFSLQQIKRQKHALCDDPVAQGCGSGSALILDPDPGEK